MADYYISGVWTDTSGIITHYAVHTTDFETGNFGLPTKMSKADAIKILDVKTNTAVTITWSYVHGGWYPGEQVYVAGTGANRFLKSKPDGKLSDNLGHLIRWNAFIA